MFAVSVKIVVEEADAESFAARLEQHATNSKTQIGCLGFSVATDHKAKGVFHIWEVYQDAAAFDAHVNADFMAQSREFTKSMVKERVLATGDIII